MVSKRLRVAAGFVLALLFMTSVFAKTKDLQEITVLAWDRGIIPPAQGNIEENWWTKYVNDHVAKLGIKVKFVPVPRAQEMQKLPTMLAAGNAPDIIFSYDKALYNLYLKNGALLDYTDYINKYGRNIKKYFSKTDLALGASKGRIYSLVYRSVPVADTTFIRKDWLNKLGLKEPTTPAEFYNVLKAFKEKDPGKVGDRLVPFALPSAPNYPFGMWYAVLMPGFLKQAPSPERMQEAALPLWPETENCLRFMNKLYNEKLLSDQFLLDKDEVLFRQKFVRGEIGAFVHFPHWPYHSAYGNMYENLNKNISDARLVATFPWTANPKNNLYEIIRCYPFGYMWYSPRNAKHPDLVVKYLDWMASSEATNVNWFGLPGIDNKIVDGIPLPVDDAKYKQRVPWIGSQYNVLRNPFVNSPEKYIKRLSMDFAPQYRDQYVRETIAGSKKLKYYQPWITEATPLYDKLNGSLMKKWEELQVKIITAPSNQFDAVFDDAIKQYKEVGGAEVAQELAQAYKAQYGK
ncbi:putative aldouronate transport system substrate-binding protein [Hydrogenispora ethanolica]|uniref:Putative aldouronate transport system substrate-binding protein n=1 Tax=Hydrogenispora ethanolica TaxID=1082276 RepID=A0A4R1SBV4_HYDET|nr:putative aldouronate transport system substrate-binding protein [Hydrogenispora ethanolica]